MNYRFLILAALALLIPVVVQAQKSDQQITFNGIPQKIYGTVPFELSATSTSGLPVSFTSSNTQVAVISGKTVTIVGTGEAAITASQPGDDNFNPAPSVQQMLVVVKANQTITFEPLPSRTFGDPSFYLVASATSGLPVSYHSSNPDVASIAGTTIIINGAGECTITASQLGNINYNAAQAVERVLVVAKATQTVHFSPLPTKTYGDAPFSISASASSGLEISYTSSSPNVSITGNQVTILGAGVAEITAAQKGNANYFPAEDVVHVLSILKAPQSITFNTIPPKTYGDLPFNLSAVTSSGLPVIFSSQYDTLLTIQGNVATIIGAGTLKIYASQSGNENYLSRMVEQTISIAKASQSIAFESLPSKKFGDSPFSVSASSSSGLPVTFTSNRKTVARLTGNIVTIVGAGTAPIVAAQAGNHNYLAAPNVVQPLVISALGNSYPVLATTRSGGNGRGTIFTIETDGSNYVLQKNFSPNANNSPQSGLIKGSDGKLYGSILGGGSPANGVVFSIQPDGTGYTVLHNFSFTDGQQPFGNVMEASNGYLYGMTYDGGANNSGVIFRLSKDGSDFSKLYEFPNGGANGYHPLGGLVEAADGDLYGMTAEGGNAAYGVLFTIKKDGSGYTKLLDLTGTSSRAGFPRGSLIQGPDQYLYGTAIRGGTSGMGVLFKVRTDGTDYVNLINFDGASKGSLPGASPILAADGKLYGTTQAGGANDMGVIYSVNMDGTGFTKLIDFNGVVSGAMGIGSLVQSTDGLLYGLTNSGGTSNMGVAFKIKTDGTGFTKLLDFDGTNGASPVFGSLLETENGKFLGMTSRGGPSNSGIIFSISSTASFSLVKAFPQPEGTPEMISSNDGNQFFGIASSGGTQGNGAIFKTSADGSGYQRILDLDGDFLFANKLVHTSDNNVWGTAVEGVFSVKNILFRLKADGTDFQRVEFSNAPGLAVQSLIEGPDQFLYGIGYINGATGAIIFRFKTDGSVFTNLAVLPGGSEGSYPTQNLVLANGQIFGLMHEGGTHNWGAVFRFDISSATYSRIFSLQSSTTGSYPKKLLMLNDGSLCIATAGGGANNSGTLFSINPDGGDYNKIYDFDPGICSGPNDVIQTVDGYLIGSTEYGGASNHGILYEMLVDGSSFRKILEFTGENGSNPTQLFFKKAEQVITFSAIPPKQYNDPDFVLAATNSSNLPVTFTSSDEGIASVHGDKLRIHGVGEVIITASTSGNKNFSPTQVQRLLTVGKDDQTIVFDPVEDITFGNDPFVLSGTATSGLEVIFSSSSDHITLTGSTVTPLSPGNVTVYANQQGDSYYNEAPVMQQTFCISPAKPVMSANESDLEKVVLTSSQSFGNQWYRNGILIPGEASVSLAISENGSYSVVSTVEGCSSEPSEAYIRNITGVDEQITKKQLLYPNPVQDRVTLDLSSFPRMSPVEIQILDINGREVLSLTTSGDALIELDTSLLKKGLHILRAASDKKITITKFVKQ